MSFSLTVLGSSSALPTSKRFPSAHALNVHEHFFLIDCGEGTQMQLRKYRIKISRINHILISHMHGDHVYGLPGLFSTFNLLGRKTDLYVYGQNDLKYLIEFYKTHFGKDLSYNIQFIPLKTKKQYVFYEDKHVTIETLPLKHRIPTIGFLFREKEREMNIRKELIEKYNISISDIVQIKKGRDYVTGKGDPIPNSELTIPPFISRSYAYCSDTLFHTRLSERVKGIDLLYHEATFLEKDKNIAGLTFHSTASQAATIAKMAGVQKLIIGHFSSRYEETEAFVSEAKKVFENTEAAEDGKEYNVPLKRRE